MSELVLYSSDDGQTHLHLRVEGETVWLSQLEIAELFQTSKQNVSLHAKNIFADNELQRDSVVKESLTTAAGGKSYCIKPRNLEGRNHETACIAASREFDRRIQKRPQAFVG